jgi:hypothetical protein
VPRIKAYTIIGTFNLGMYEYDANYIFMPLDGAQKYFGLKDSATVIDVSLHDEKQLPMMRALIEKTVSLGAYVYDWKESNAAFFNAIDVERNVMFLILLLIILVAAFNIITCLIINRYIAAMNHFLFSALLSFICSHICCRYIIHSFYILTLRHIILIKSIRSENSALSTSLIIYNSCYATIKTTLFAMQVEFSCHILFNSRIMLFTSSIYSSTFRAEPHIHIIIKCLMAAFTYNLHISS